MEVKLSITAQEILTYNSDEPISLSGKFKAHAESERAGTRDIITIFHVTTGNPGNHLSFSSCVDLELIQVSGNVNHLPTTGSANTDEIINTYPEFFQEKIGQFEDYEVKL